MVIDLLSRARMYESLRPGFAAAFDFLRRNDLASLPQGRLELDGSRLFAIVQEYETRPIRDGNLEAHRAYIDIQTLARGEEIMGYAPLDTQRAIVPFDTEKDIAFYEGDAAWVRFIPGWFAIFFPHDAHLPGRCVAQPLTVKKVVVKVAI